MKLGKSRARSTPGGAAALPDAEVAKMAARLWPHRKHEAGIVGLFCRPGLHHWRRLDTATLLPGREVRFCFWCEKVKLDGVVI